MPTPLAPADFLEKARTRPVIDVRSPGEYAHAHVPDAVNIPLFDAAERAQVGTRYKQVGRDAAVLLGLELVGPKLAQFVEESQQLNPDGGEVLVHCWRGGMRSGSFAWLLETAGMSVSTLVGGYKAYRNAVLAGVAQPRNVLILGGKTGSAKTETLYELARLGEQVIDLEALAHHRGSSYGMIGQAPQPSSEQFQNDLHRVWMSLDPTRRVWLEDESKAVGACYLPDGLWAQMRTAPVAFLDVPLETRVIFLVETYGRFPHEALVEATDRIRKRIGNDRHQLAMQALEQFDYARVAELALGYYDKAYLHGLAQREPDRIHVLPTSEINPAETARRLVAWAEGR
jgi:tRNA 2-selenouridine synthase